MDACFFSSPLDAEGGSSDRFGAAFDPFDHHSTLPLPPWSDGQLNSRTSSPPEVDNDAKFSLNLDGISEFFHSTKHVVSSSSTPYDLSSFGSQPARSIESKSSLARSLPIHSNPDHPMPPIALPPSSDTVQACADEHHSRWQTLLEAAQHMSPLQAKQWIDTLGQVRFQFNAVFDRFCNRGRGVAPLTPDARGGSERACGVATLISDARAGSEREKPDFWDDRKSASRLSPEGMPKKSTVRARILLPVLAVPVGISASKLQQKCLIILAVQLKQLKGKTYAKVEYVELPIGSLHASLRPRSCGGSGQLGEDDVRIMLLQVACHLALQTRESSTLTAVFQQPRFSSGGVYPTALVLSEKELEPIGELSSVGYVISTSDSASGDHSLSTLLTKTSKTSKSDQRVVFENAHFSFLSNPAVASRIQQIDQHLSSSPPIVDLPSSPKTRPEDKDSDNNTMLDIVILPQNRSAAVNMLLQHTHAMDTSIV